jgi:hypothetical protein
LLLLAVPEQERAVLLEVVLESFLGVGELGSPVAALMRRVLESTDTLTRRSPSVSTSTLPESVSVSESEVATSSRPLA